MHKSVDRLVQYFNPQPGQVAERNIPMRGLGRGRSSGGRSLKGSEAQLQPADDSSPDGSLLVGISLSTGSQIHGSTSMVGLMTILDLTELATKLYF